MVLLLFAQGEDMNRNLFEGLLQYLEKDILMRVIATLIMIENLMMDEGPLEEEDDIMIEVEGHQIAGMINGEVILEEEDPMMMEDPQIMEDPLEIEDIQDNLEDKDHQAPQVTLDMTALEIPLVQLASQCCNWLELKTKQIDIYNNTYNKGK